MPPPVFSCFLLAVVFLMKIPVLMRYIEKPPSIKKKKSTNDDTLVSVVDLSFPTFSYQRKLSWLLNCVQIAAGRNSVIFIIRMGVGGVFFSFVMVELADRPDFSSRRGAKKTSRR